MCFTHYAEVAISSKGARMRSFKVSQVPLKLFAGTACVVLIFSMLDRSVCAALTSERLRNLAGPFFIGYASANDFWNLSDTTMYQAIAKSEFNILTSENQMKWDTIHPNRAVYNFVPADQHVQFAQANTMKVHGHTLVWHRQLPGWVTNPPVPWTKATLTEVLYDHIGKVVGHYKDQVAVWDVVNEAFNEHGTYRRSLWYTTIGKKYIELAFQRARAADPSAKLIYNDFAIDTGSKKSTAVYNMVSDFKRRGIPIDGVGLQMHLKSGGLNYDSFAANMQRFADLGLEIYITEMDVRFPISRADLNNQATIYCNVLRRCLAQSACKALQMWGFTDKYSWVPGRFSGQGAALIFDEHYNPKPAYYALQSALSSLHGVTNCDTWSQSLTHRDHQ